jgi:hypothetical protein
VSYISDNGIAPIFSRDTKRETFLEKNKKLEQNKKLVSKNLEQRQMTQVSKD